MNDMKPMVHLSFDLLPESKDWQVGKAYRVRLVLKQTGMMEDGATFEVVDATSLERADKGRRFYTTENGTIKS